MALEVDSKAPEFTLKQKTADGLVEVSLGDHLGKKKIVLLFFPFAFTSVCEEELCTVSGGLGDYEKLNATVFAVSGDSPFAQEAFAQKAGITIPILSDYNHEVAGLYDVRYDELLGFHHVAKRSAFVIGEDGKIAFSWSSDNPKDLPPFDEIQSALSA